MELDFSGRPLSAVHWRRFRLLVITAQWSYYGYWTAVSNRIVGFLMSCETKQPIICVHKQLINTLNMSNYVYLAILAKFHAGQLYSASLNSLSLKKCRADWLVGVFSY